MKTGRCVLMISAALAGNATADIVLDGSLGKAGAITSTQIPAELGQQRGANLFHSFSRFDIPAGETVSFTGNPNIENIISRVTGGVHSQLDGTLRVEIPNANFYLLNPAGILLGKDAHLDSTGSFYLSTAQHLSLGTTGRFSTQLGENSTLSTAAPSAFGFLGNAAAIQLQGSQLKLVSGKTLNLSAGELQLKDSNLQIPEGQIVLQTTTTPTELPIMPTSAPTETPSGHLQIENSELNVNSQERAAGTISLHAGELTLRDSQLYGRSEGNGNAGQVLLYADNIRLENSTLSTTTYNAGQGGAIDLQAKHQMMLDNGLIAANTEGTGNAGTIAIDAENLSLKNSAQITSSSYDRGNAGAITLKLRGTLDISGGDPDFSGIYSSTHGEQAGAGAAGTIQIVAQNILLSNQGRIVSNSFGTGAGGEITLTAAEHIALNQGYIFSNAFGAGNAGTILIETPVLYLSNGAGIASDTESSGLGGTISLYIADTLRVNDTASHISTNTSGSGEAGLIHIDTQNLQLNDGAVIEGNTQGSGNSGQIQINATAAVVLNNARLLIDTQSKDSNAGNADLLLIETPHLQLNAASKITSNTDGNGQGGVIQIKGKDIILEKNSQISTNTTAAGEAGLIYIDTQNLSLRDAASIAGNTFATGLSGQIQIFATGSVQLSRSEIAANAQGTGGNADLILISTPYLQLRDGAKITSNTDGAGLGGVIKLQIGDSTLITGRDSGLMTNTAGTGAAGEIVLNSPHLYLNNAQISSATAGAGSGGTISIVAKNIVLLGDAKISADSQNQGRAGDIVLQVQDSLQLNNARITTRANNSEGGNISIYNNGLANLQSNSSIETNVQGGNGNGGDIQITTAAETPQKAFVILANSQVRSSADYGNGGAIRLDTTQQFLKDIRSNVDASSRRGVSGLILIESPLTDVGNKIVDIPENFVSVADLIQQTCAAQAQQNRSSFVRATRHGFLHNTGNLWGSGLLRQKSMQSAHFTHAPATFSIAELGCGR